MAVGCGSALGALARYGVSVWLTPWNKSGFPWSTWLINVAGAFLLGWVTFAVGHPSRLPIWYTFASDGFCGGFTTFSTLAWETVTLFRRKPLLAGLYIGSSISVGLVMAWTFRVA